MRVPANYFDGVTSQLNPIEIEVIDDKLMLYLFREKRDYKLSQLKIQDGIGSAYLSIELPKGGRLECPGIKSREQLGLKRNSAFLKFLEKGPLGLLVSLGLVVVGVFISAVYFLPLATDTITPKVPNIIFEQVDSVTLSSLDERMLKPSELTETQQKEIKEYFETLNKNSLAPGDYHLQFRATKDYMPNAFTLSGTTIVVTDDLVNLLKNKEAIGAILAHELGHHQLHHVKKSLVRISTLAILIAVTTGDFSNTIGQLSAALWQLSLSREDEFAADEFGSNLLKKVGSDPILLANGLEQLETALEGKKGKLAELTEGFKLIETHPDTGERVRKLKGG